MEGFRIIREASFAVMSLCGEQKYNFTRQYRLSDFIFRCEIGDSSLFYSCLTGELVEVTKHEKAFQYLVRHWFYVEKDLNEKENVPKLRTLLLRRQMAARALTIAVIVMKMVSNKCQ